MIDTLAPWKRHDWKLHPGHPSAFGKLLPRTVLFQSLPPYSRRRVPQAGFLGHLSSLRVALERDAKRRAGVGGVRALLCLRLA